MEAAEGISSMVMPGMEGNPGISIPRIGGRDIPPLPPPSIEDMLLLIIEEEEDEEEKEEREKQALLAAHQAKKQQVEQSEAHRLDTTEFKIPLNIVPKSSPFSGWSTKSSKKPLCLCMV